MSSSFLLTNSMFVPSLHSGRSSLLSIKPITTIKSESSPSPFKLKYLPGSSLSLSNSGSNSKLLFRSLKALENTGRYDHHLLVSRRLEIGTAADEEIAAESDEKMDKVEGFLDACWRLSRPFVLKRTLVTLVAIAARVWIPNAHSINWNTLPLKALAGFFAAACAHIFMDGLNQIYDLDIDKINKPNLPIPAGDITLKSAWGLVTFAGVCGLSLVLMTKPPVLVTQLYCLVLLFGYVYSVPPFRLKRFPFTAFLIITTLTCFLNVAGFAACRAAARLPFEWSPDLIYTTIMGIMFGATTSFMKDIPDVEGDSKHGIDTLATRFGARNIAFLAIGTLILGYATAILTSIFIPQTGFRLAVFIPANIILPLLIMYKARVLPKENFSREAIYRYYMYLWDLKNVEIGLLPFI